MEPAIVQVIELIDGNFQVPPDKVLFIKEDSTVRFICGTKKVTHLTPLLLTDRNIKRRMYENNEPEIKRTGKISKKGLNEKYKIIYGSLNQEGYWLVDKQFNYIGPIAVQMIFVKEEGEDYVIEALGKQEKIIVEPLSIDLRDLNIMTVFPRCIGEFPKWKQFFDYQTQNLGYNAFHFPPIHKLGASNSYYSISDHIRLNPQFFPNQANSYQDLESLVKQYNKTGVYFFIDIVLNHISYDSEWLLDNRDAVYTVENTPKLRSAFEVDQIIFEWGETIRKRQLPGYDKMSIDSEEDIEFLVSALRAKLQNKKIWEYFQIGEECIKKMGDLLKTSPPSSNIFIADPVVDIQKFLQTHITNLGVGRYAATVKNLETMWAHSGILYEKQDLIDAWTKVNQTWRQKIEEWMDDIPRAIAGELRYYYRTLDWKIDERRYLVKRYFSYIRSGYYALNNGWVGGINPLENFATCDNFHYLRRNVNIWGDLVKLRYGKSKKESPALWKMMKNHVQLMAKHFNGFRLDNCHGTPLAVGQYMMRNARKVNPNIIIFAELFTNSHEQDAIFIKNIGINAMVKESVHHLSSGSFVRSFYKNAGSYSKHSGSLPGVFEKDLEKRQFVKPRKPTYVLYDLTHDNRTYTQEGVPYKQLPLTVMLPFLGTAIGTTKGFDQYHKIKVEVIETRQLYQHDVPSTSHSYKTQSDPTVFSFSSSEKGKAKVVEIVGSWDSWTNRIQLPYIEGSYRGTVQLPVGNFQYKILVDGVETNDTFKPNVRENGNHSINIKDFYHKRLEYNNLEGIRHLLNTVLKEKYAQYEEIYMRSQSDNGFVEISKNSPARDKSIYILSNLSERSQHGVFQLPGLLSSAQIWTHRDPNSNNITQSYNIREFFDINFNHTSKCHILVSTELPRGFCCLIECTTDPEHYESIRKMEILLEEKPAFNAANLETDAINQLMFGCTREEEIRYGSSNYVLPGHGQLVYGGLAGLYKILKDTSVWNTLSHPIYDNLREGDWLLDYMLQRLNRNKKLNQIRLAISEVFRHLKSIPRYLIPHFFNRYIYTIVRHIKDSVLQPKDITIPRTDFAKRLYLASCQFIARLPSMKPLYHVTMAAGLPHFSTGWARSWGRDTFTCNQILLMHPGVYRNIIIGFASAVRHHLIPNLLDEGNRPRFNCRDATWWFLRGVKQYVNHTGDYALLKEPIELLFPEKPENNVMILQDIIHGIFQSYDEGVFFREKGAGIEIDSNMHNQGFNISLKVDEETGFIVGGNPRNCLTWMDKMGSSVQAKNKGIPATSRNGAPIELVGLLKHCLDGFAELYEKSYYSYYYVTYKEKKITYRDWGSYIQANFEMWFWIPQDPREKTHPSIQEQYIKVRGMYKDTVKSYSISEEYRLRPNGVIAMAVAPELFKPEHARRYLKIVEETLISDKSLGISTLHSIHTSLHHPSYNNDDDSIDPKVAHGFNYHNGPEWVWLYGFYVKAKLNFMDEKSKLTRRRAMGLLQNHISHIKNDEWMSLPELTNQNGQFNKFSCPAQAWSISSTVLALQEISKLKDE